MKNHILNYFWLALLLLSAHVQAQAVKGFYVNGFHTILGNTAKEDSLLIFAHNNGFNYLTLYNLHQINIETQAGSDRLSSFISRAKADYGILEIGGATETYDFVRDYLHPYNLQHSDPSERIDVYNLEFEFWSASSTDTGGYYCQYYLEPANLPCSVDGAYQFYTDLLYHIDSLANSAGLKSEAYLGWFDSTQAVGLVNTGVDRLFTHIYMTSAAFSQNSQYNYVKQRLQYLGESGQTVKVYPLYDSEPDFMQSWAATHDFFEPFQLLQASLAAETGTWKNNLDVSGIQWFAYSYMPKKNMSLALSEHEKDAFRISQNEESVQISAEGRFTYELLDLSGKQLVSGNEDQPAFSAHFSHGIYLLNIHSGTEFHTVKLFL